MTSSITKEKYINRFNEAHGFGRYNYMLLPEIIKCTEKVPILCEHKDEEGNVHGIFFQSPDSHGRGHGCSKCYGNDKLSKEQFVKRALNIEKHKNQRYTYDNFKYINSDTKGQIDCPMHGPFFKSPDKHINVGQGCPECMKEELRAMFATSRENFIEKASNVPEHKNKGYKYDWFLYKNGKTKGKICCPKKGHGFFTQKPDHHLAGVGCPCCRESKGEIKILELLTKHKICFNRQKTFEKCINPKTNKKLKFDFYLPLYNMCIEYDGLQHFEVVKYWGGISALNLLKYRDKIKIKFCKKHKIRLVRITYKDNIKSKFHKILLKLK